MTEEIESQVREQIKRVARELGGDEAPPTRTVLAAVTAHLGITRYETDTVYDRMKAEGEIYEADGNVKVTDDYVSEPETAAEATASGLGLAAVRELVDRHGDDEGAPRAEIESAVGHETVAMAIRKGAIYESGDELRLTDDEVLAGAEDYEQAREAAGGSTHEDENPGLVAAKGTYSTVKSVIAARSKSSPVTLGDLKDRLDHFDPETVAAVAADLAERGEVTRHESVEIDGLDREDTTEFYADERDLSTIEVSRP